jgi:aldehyde:ferredoxin oxidoreductase
MKGWTGKTLIVDLTHGTIATEPLNMDIATLFIGGRGLGVDWERGGSQAGECQEGFEVLTPVPEADHHYRPTLDPQPVEASRQGGAPLSQFGVGRHSRGLDQSGAVWEAPGDGGDEAGQEHYSPHAALRVN